MWAVAVGFQPQCGPPEQSSDVRLVLEVSSDGDAKAGGEGPPGPAVQRRDGPGALLVKWSIDGTAGKCRQNQSKEGSDPNKGQEGGLE